MGAVKTGLCRGVFQKLSRVPLMSGAGLKIPLISIHQMRALSSCIVPYRTLRCRFRSAQRLDLSVNWPTTCPSEPGERDLWRGVATPLGAGSGAAGVCVGTGVSERPSRGGL